MAHLVRNERLKLRANALDRASTASLAVGGLTPLATAPTMSVGVVAAFLSWLALAASLHFVADHVLKGLRDD